MVFEVGIHGDSGHVTHIADSTVVVLFVFMFSVEGTHVHNLKNKMKKLISFKLRIGGVSLNI